MPVESVSQLAEMGPPVLLVLTRIGGLFLFAPLLSSQMIPRQVKILLVAMLTLCAYPVVAESGNTAASVDLVSLPVLMCGELMVGSIIGLMAMMPVMAVQLAGTLAGQQMGLGVASIFNPAVDLDGDSLAQLLFISAIAIFLSLGGLDALFYAIVRTYEGLPSGVIREDLVPMDGIVAMMTGAFDVGLRIAMPVLAIIFLENVVVGFIMKTVPQLNILSFGFPVRILIGMFVTFASMLIIAEVIGGHVSETLDLIVDWSESLK